MTGRAAGYCAGYSVPGYMNPAVPGRGMARGYGRGIGRGMAWRGPAYGRGRPGPWGGAPYYPPYPPYPQEYAPPYPPQYSEEEELNILKDQAQYFQDQLENIQKRIEELEKEKKDES
jgi:hypothetical protein